MSRTESCSCLLQLEGLHMRVDRAAPPCQENSARGGVHYERGRSAFVGNLPFDVEVRSLPQHVLLDARSERDLQLQLAASVLREPGQQVAHCMALSFVQGLLVTESALVFQTCCSA